MTRVSLVLVVVALLAVCPVGHLFLSPARAESTPVPGVVTALTPALVEAFIKQMERTAVDRKLENLAPLLADELKIIITNMPTPQGPQRLEMGKGEYLANTSQVFDAMEKYELDRKGQDIQIADGGEKAIVRATVTERVTIQGKTIETTAKEVATIEVIEGRIQVSRIESDVVEVKE